MNKISQPAHTVEKSGEIMILRVKGGKGVEMPLHYCTNEAIVIVHKGSAILRMSEENHLREGDTFIIPAGYPHSLYLTEQFEALVIMLVNAKIEFQK